LTPKEIYIAGVEQSQPPGIRVSISKTLCGYFTETRQTRIRCQRRCTPT